MSKIIDDVMINGDKEILVWFDDESMKFFNSEKITEKIQEIKLLDNGDILINKEILILNKEILENSIEKPMSPRVIDVEPLENYKVLLTFKNGEKKIYDVSPFLEFKMWQELKDVNLFNTVKAVGGTIEWIHEQDICPDDLYINSVAVEDFEYKVKNA